MYFGAMAKKKTKLAKALETEMEWFEEESIAELEKRSGVHRQTLHNILEGKGCSINALKLLELASQGRIGLHSVDAPGE